MQEPNHFLFFKGIFSPLHKDMLALFFYSIHKILSKLKKHI